MPNTWYNIQVMVSIGHGTGEATMWVMKQGDSQFTKVGDVTGIINDNVAVGATGRIGAGATNVQIGPFEPTSSMISTQKSFAVTTWYDDTIASTTFINP